MQWIVCNTNSNTSFQPKPRFNVRYGEEVPGASSAVVVLVRGLRRHFRQIIHYDQGALTLGRLHALITQVEDVGGRVRSLTFDMGNPTIQVNLGDRNNL